MASYSDDKEKLLSRLKRIEGQVRGIQRMIKDDKQCTDILTQISSVIGATQKVGYIILNDHVKGCIKNSLALDDDGTAVQELLDVIQRFAKS